MNNSGKSLRMFLEFQKAIEQGKTAEYHHPDYVVMSRKRYDEISCKNGIERIQNFLKNAPQHSWVDTVLDICRESLKP